jgi:hypothetical protein
MKKRSINIILFVLAFSLLGIEVQNQIINLEWQNISRLEDLNQDAIEINESENLAILNLQLKENYQIMELSFETNIPSNCSFQIENLLQQNIHYFTTKHSLLIDNLLLGETYNGILTVWDSEGNVQTITNITLTPSYLEPFFWDLTDVFINLTDFPYKYATGDLNRDGYDDLVFCTFDYNIYWIEVSEHGYSLPIFIAYNGYYANGLNLIDFDQDGDVDLICDGSSVNIFYFYENLGVSPITFTKHELSISLSTSIGDIGIVDVDNDSDLDIIVLEGPNQNARLLLLENEGNLTFNTRYLSNSGDFGSWGSSLAVGDIDNDLDIDIAICTGNSNYNDQVYWFENDGGFTAFFSRHTVNFTLVNEMEDYWNIEFIDYDLDADLDLIVSTNFRKIYLLEYENYVYLDPKTIINTSSAPRNLIVFDFNHEIFPDIISGGDDYISIHLNEINGTFTSINVPRIFETEIMGIGLVTNENNDHPQILFGGRNPTILKGLLISILDPTDTDGDGLSDSVEVNIYNTDPNDSDTDGDGLSDFVEVNIYNTDPNDSNTDGDGLSDGDEVNTYSTDPNDSDTDGDGLSDGDEVNTYSTDPNNSLSNPITYIILIITILTIIISTGVIFYFKARNS